MATAYWRLTITQLEGAGHRALPDDLPCGDPDAGLPEYAAIIVEAPRAVLSQLLWPNRWAASAQ